jgi:hypothetical protein
MECGRALPPTNQPVEWIASAAFWLAWRRTARRDQRVRAYHTKTEPRPHREALSPSQAATCSAGRRVLGGWMRTVWPRCWRQRVPHPPRLARPAGLTEREVEVVGLLSRGCRPSRSHTRWALDQDGRPAGAKRLRQDRRLNPRRGHRVRHAARPRSMGENSQWLAPALAPNVAGRAPRHPGCAAPKGEGHER